MITDRLLALFPPFDSGRLVNMMVSGAFTLLSVWLGARFALKGERQRARRDIELAYAREVAATIPGYLRLVENVQETIELAEQGVGKWLYSSMSVQMNGRLDALASLAHRAGAEAGAVLLGTAVEVERLAGHAVFVNRPDVDDQWLPEADPRIPAGLEDALERLRHQLESWKELAVQELRDLAP